MTEGTTITEAFDVHVTVHRVTFLIIKNQLDALISQIYSWNETLHFLGFSYRASFICVTIRITNRCDSLYYVFISFFSSFPYMSRAFMGPSSGVFQAVVLCYHLVHAVLCWSSACVSGRWRTQTINIALHEPNGSIKTTAWNTPDDGLMKARNL